MINQFNKIKTELIDRVDPDYANFKQAIRTALEMAKDL